MVSKLRRDLPLGGHAVREVEGDARFYLMFDDPAESTIGEKGPSSLRPTALKKRTRCHVRTGCALFAALAVTVRHSVPGSLAASARCG